MSQYRLINILAQKVKKETVINTYVNDEKQMVW